MAQQMEGTFETSADNCARTRPSPEGLNVYKFLFQAPPIPVTKSALGYRRGRLAVAGHCEREPASEIESRGLHAGNRTWRATRLIALAEEMPR